MKIVIFGLTISSSWGNGHATLWRGLGRALAELGHRVVFFEHDVPYYAAFRDFWQLPWGELVLYGDWNGIVWRARMELADAEVAIVTSYCPDAVAAGELLLDRDHPMRVFYDLDTPVTLLRLSRGEAVSYIGPRGLADFDLVLSFTGGAALETLQQRLGARRVAPLYGHVDPEVHRPVAPVERYRAVLSYLGTYALDRQAALEILFVEPAKRASDKRFLIGGAQYPQNFPWSRNIFFVRHLPPSEHPAFFSSSRLTLNVTRRDMAQMGWCPSGRLFEATACGTPVVSDAWNGLDAFFEPGREIFTARTSDDVLAILAAPEAEVRRVASASRERTLDQHTSAHRAAQFIASLESVRADHRPVPAETVEA
jgi:spore maturation protein CgeB